MNIVFISGSFKIFIKIGGSEAIPVTTFPDYVMNIMQRGNKMLACEYEVSDYNILVVYFIHKVLYIIIQRIEDSFNSESEVACLPYNIRKNKFKNIFPCV